MSNGQVWCDKHGRFFSPARDKVCIYCDPPALTNAKNPVPKAFTSRKERLAAKLKFFNHKHIDFKAPNMTDGQLESALIYMEEVLRADGLDVMALCEEFDSE